MDGKTNKWMDGWTDVGWTDVGNFSPLCTECTKLLPLSAPLTCFQKEDLVMRLQIIFQSQWLNQKYFPQTYKGKVVFVQNFAELIVSKFLKLHF